MKIILGSINNNHLHDIMKETAHSTKEVWAAVAYAYKQELLFDWCRENSIPLTFYGRLDHRIAVDIDILEKFLKKKYGEQSECFLVEEHHAKVIWWKGLGVYIGSANLTDKAWNENIEAGCYFKNHEINKSMEADLNLLFARLCGERTELSQELLDDLKKEKAANPPTSNRDRIYRKYGKKSRGLKVAPSTRDKSNQKRSKKVERFLGEQRRVMDILIQIQRHFDEPSLYPQWVPSRTPKAWQVDQFLNWYYQDNKMMKKIENVEQLHNQNNSSKEDTLLEAVKHWRRLKKSPHDQEELLKKSMPYVHEKLSVKNIDRLSEGDLYNVLSMVNASRQYATRANKKTLGLHKSNANPEDRLRHLAKQIFHNTSKDGLDFKATLKYLIYGNADIEFLQRLWECCGDKQRYKIKFLGQNTLWEMAGWAMPEKYPPANDRVRKALRGLGYDISIYRRNLN